VDIRVKRHEEVLVRCELVVTLLNALSDPLLKGRPEDGAAEIQQELSGQAVPLLLDGQELQHDSRLFGVLQDLLDRQRWVVRGPDVPDLVDFHAI